MYHTEDYLRFILDSSSMRHSNHEEKCDFGLEEVSRVMLHLYALRPIYVWATATQDCPPFRGMSDYVRLVAGGTLTGL